MPWVLEETFAAGGLDLHAEVTLRRLDPLYRIRWAGDERHLRLLRRRRAAARARSRASRPATRRSVDAFLAALRPIYEQGILGAGRRAFGDVRSFAALLPSMARLRAIEPLHRFVARYFEHPRVREAFSFHSLFIGGDPYRVPAIYGALVYLQVLDGGWYADGGVYSLVEAMARPLDVRCGERVRGIETRGRPRDRRAAGGRRALRRRRRRLQRRRPAHARAARPPRRRCAACGRRCPASCSTSGRTGASTGCCTTRCWSATATASSSARSRAATAAAAHLLDLRARAGAHGARDGGGRRRLAGVLLPVPNLRARDRLGARGRPAARRARADLEATFGLDGLDASRRGRAPHDPARLRARARRRGATRSRSSRRCTSRAYFRAPNRDRGVRGLYHVGGGTHPGAGVPGVLLGAEVTAGLVTATAAVVRGPREAGSAACDDRRGRAVVVEARATTNARRAHVRARLPAAAARRARRRLPALPRLPHARRPRRRAAPRRRGARRRRRGVGGRRGAGARRARSRSSTDLALRHPLPGGALATSAPGMRYDLVRAAFDDRGRRSTATATAWPARSGIVMAAAAGHPRCRARAPGGRGARHGDAADEHPARHRRGRRGGRVYLARETIARSRIARAGTARGAAARPDRPRRRALRTRASRASRGCRAGAARSPPPAPCTARSCARSSATGLRRDAGRRGRVALPQDRRRRCGPRRGREAPRTVRRAGRGRRAGGGAGRLWAAPGAHARRPRGRCSCCCSRASARRGGPGAGRAPGRGRALASAGAIGFAAELLGVATGRPFGRYAYSAQLGPRVARRPAARRRGLGDDGAPRMGRGRLGAPAPGRCAFRSPRPASPRGTSSSTPAWCGRATGRGRGGGRYEGVPATNFAGWFAHRARVSAVRRRARRRRGRTRATTARSGLYAWTWVGRGDCQRGPVAAAAGRGGRRRRDGGVRRARAARRGAAR